jgi:hypothetical protein
MPFDSQTTGRNGRFPWKQVIFPLLCASGLAIAQTGPALQGAVVATPVTAASTAAVVPVAPVLIPQPAIVDAYESAEAALYDQLRKVILGTFPCGAGIKVSVLADPRLADRYHVVLGRRTYHMHSVPTSTGIVRLEDSAEGLVWLQLANKSMLMNSKLGRRLADDCMSEPQVRMVQLLREKPQPELLK